MKWKGEFGSMEQTFAGASGKNMQNKTCRVSNALRQSTLVSYQKCGNSCFEKRCECPLPNAETHFKKKMLDMNGWRQSITDKWTRLDKHASPVVSWSFPICPRTIYSRLSSHSHGPHGLSVMTRQLSPSILRSCNSTPKRNIWSDWGSSSQVWT